MTDTLALVEMTPEQWITMLRGEWDDERQERLTKPAREALADAIERLRDENADLIHDVEKLKDSLSKEVTESERLRQDRMEFLFAWMRAPSPMLGGYVPLDLMRAGRGEKVAAFIEQAHRKRAALAKDAP